MSDGSLSDRLDWLFTTLKFADGERLSYGKVSDALKEHQGVYVSREYLRQLRTGVRTNPNLDLVRALAKFFGVSMTFILEGTVPSVAPADADEDDHALGIPFAGVPGKGKTHVVAQAVRAAVERGDRVLIAGSTSQAVESAVQQVQAPVFSHVVGVASTVAQAGPITSPLFLAPPSGDEMNDDEV